MSKITEYTVVSALYRETAADETHNRLSSQVNDHILAGWQPFGTLSTSNISGVLVLMQPMVRYEH